MSRRSFIVVAAAVLAVGCTSLAPTYERPAAPVAARFAGDAGPVTGPVASELDWQRFFGDERLKRLIAIALANNRDLRISVLNIEQARATWQIRRADQFPSVGAGLNYQRAPGATGSLINTYSVGLAVTGYELDLFGRVRSLTQAALAQYLATEEARKSTQIALIAAVATGHLALLADDELLRVTRETLATRDDSFRLTKLKFDNGAASEIDFRQAETLLEGARATYAATLRQRAQDENALVLLLGQPLPADLPAPLPLASQQVTTELPEWQAAIDVVHHRDSKAAYRAASIAAVVSRRFMIMLAFR